jgi:hypothetical protein
MAGLIQSQVFNPITGLFGTGAVAVFPGNQSSTTSKTYTFTIPAGIGALRVRVWGGGGYNGGCGGGFAMKTIYNLIGITSVTITSGCGSNSGAGGTSSFGSYVSATGGATAGGTAGTGAGGDINFTGGVAAGGAAGLFGNGGGGGTGGNIGNGNAGGGSYDVAYSGGSGFTGVGGFYSSAATCVAAASPFLSQFSIDFISTGGGGGYRQNGVNGGGGGYSGTGGFPAGGGGTNASGGAGLVIVEW